MPSLENIRAFFVRSRIQFVNTFWLFQALLFLCVVISALWSPLRFQWKQLGELSANLAVLFYCASVIPGILRRLNVSGPLRLLQQVLLVYRRQTGIAMFIFATYHYLWSRGFQLIFTRAPLLPTTLAELAGSAALLLTMPLFLTSNDLSIKKMGQKWRLLHRLAYIIPLLISLHVLLLNSASITTVVLMVIIFAQISSWILFWRNSHVQSKM